MWFKKKNKQHKEPSLFRKLIAIYYEQAMRRKALRILVKQTWSLEFLSLMLAKAAKLSANNVIMQITNKDGVTLTITYDKAKANIEKIDDTIFNHLDDDIAVQDFIRKNSTR
jgi:hypothetical protein